MTTEHHNKLVGTFTHKYPFIKVEGFRADSLTIVQSCRHRAARRPSARRHRQRRRAQRLGIEGARLVAVLRVRGSSGISRRLSRSRGVLQLLYLRRHQRHRLQSKTRAQDDAPKTFDDLLLPKWSDKLGMEAELAKLFAALVPLWGRQKTVDYFSAMMKQKPLVRSGRTLLAQLMAAGEFSVGLGYYGYRMLELQEAGMPLEIVQADPIIAWPFRLLLAKNARQPNAAKLFIDYVLSEEGQRFMASLGRTVVRPGVKNKYPQLVDGVKLVPGEALISAKIMRELSKTYYGIVNR